MDFEFSLLVPRGAEAFPARAVVASPRLRAKKLKSSFAAVRGFLAKEMNPSAVASRWQCVLERAEEPGKD